MAFCFDTGERTKLASCFTIKGCPRISDNFAGRYFSVSGFMILILWHLIFCGILALVVATMIAVVVCFASWAKGDLLAVCLLSFPSQPLRCGKSQRVKRAYAVHPVFIVSNMREAEIVNLFQKPVVKISSGCRKRAQVAQARGPMEIKIMLASHRFF